jgi:hypothetical protein
MRNCEILLAKNENSDSMLGELSAFAVQGVLKEYVGEVNRRVRYEVR